MSARDAAPVAGGVDDWDEHWTRYEGSNAENPANAYRRRLIFDLLEDGAPPERLLDIGSGQGDLLAAARARWSTVELAGVEMSAAGIDIASRKVRGATFVQRDLMVEQAPDPAMRGWAGHAVCTEVLEHVDDPARLLRSASSYLAPGARVVITVPGGPMSAFDEHIGHRTHYTTDMLAAVMREGGLRVERVDGAGFPFFNLYRRLVILRGEKLVDEVDTSGGELSKPAQLVLRGFDVAFRLNRPATRWGTQIVGVGRAPA